MKGSGVRVPASALRLCHRFWLGYWGLVGVGRAARVATRARGRPIEDTSLLCGCCGDTAQDRLPPVPASRRMRERADSRGGMSQLVLCGSALGWVADARLHTAKREQRGDPERLRFAYGGRLWRVRGASDRRSRRGNSSDPPPQIRAGKLPARILIADMVREELLSRRCRRVRLRRAGRRTRASAPTRLEPPRPGRRDACH